MICRNREKPIVDRSAEFAKLREQIVAASSNFKLPKPVYPTEKPERKESERK